MGPALLLEHPPRPGLRGLLVDALHVLQGTRALLIGVLCLGLPLPPLGALVTQAGTTLLSYNPRGYCHTQASVPLQACPRGSGVARCCTR